VDFKTAPLPEIAPDNRVTACHCSSIPDFLRVFSSTTDFVVDKLLKELMRCSRYSVVAQFEIHRASRIPSIGN
jgi:hypothetical protein